MDLNHKTVSILETLLENDGKASIDELMHTLQISKQPLYYHLEHLNQALKAAMLPAIYVDNGKLILNLENKKSIDKFLHSFDHSNYIFSKEERRRLVVILISLSVTPVSLKTMCDFLMVSRNTILSDITEIRGQLENFALTLTSQRNSGYQINGDEWALRYYLIDSLYQLRTTNASNTALQFMLDTLLEVSNRYSGLNLQKDLISIILDAEKNIRGRLTHNSVKELANYLLVIALRNFATRKPCPGSDLFNLFCEQSEYKAAEIIIEQMQSSGIYILPGEQIYLTAALLGSELYDYELYDSPEMEEIKKLTKSLITTFEQKAFICFDQRDELSERLLLHVRALYYRLKYHIKIQNILAEKIKRATVKFTI